MRGNCGEAAAWHISLGLLSLCGYIIIAGKVERGGAWTTFLCIIEIPGLNAFVTGNCAAKKSTGAGDGGGNGCEKGNVQKFLCLFFSGLCSRQQAYICIYYN